MPATTHTFTVIDSALVGTEATGRGIAQTHRPVDVRLVENALNDLCIDTALRELCAHLEGAIAPADSLREQQTGESVVTEQPLAFETVQGRVQRWVAPTTRHKLALQLEACVFAKSQ